MIDITPRTVEILKNFCTINKSIVIKPGNQIATLSINKNILAIADVEEAFDSEIAIIFHIIRIYDYHFDMNLFYIRLYIAFDQGGKREREI